MTNYYCVTCVYWDAGQTYYRKGEFSEYGDNTKYISSTVIPGKETTTMRKKIAFLNILYLKYVVVATPAFTTFLWIGETVPPLNTVKNVFKAIGNCVMNVKAAALFSLNKTQQNIVACWTQCDAKYQSRLILCTLWFICALPLIL